MATDEVAALAQQITKAGWIPNSIDHGDEVAENLIAVDGRGCGDDELKCLFYELSSRQCPQDTDASLLCAPKTTKEHGVWFVRPQEYITWKLTR